LFKIVVFLNPAGYNYYMDDKRGKKHVAEIIIEKAQEHGVPIRKDPPLAELLATVPPDTSIPQELYEAVAEILAQIISLDMKK